MGTRRKRLTTVTVVLAGLLVAAVGGCLGSDNLTTEPQLPTPRLPQAMPASTDKATALINEWIADDPVIAWGWVDMVLTYGFWKHYEVSGDPKILDYIADYMDDDWRGYQPIASDWLSPAVLDLLVCKETGAADNCERLPEYDDYFVTVNREDGMTVHWTGVPEIAREVWVDTIFMAGAYMIERARMLDGDESTAWWNDVTLQFIKFDTYLTDADTGLMNHAYDFSATDPIMNGPDAFWGRGNSWYVAALGFTLQVLPDDHPDRPALEQIWHDRIDALIPLQDENGYWHTLLLRTDDDYPEASATALIAYGIAAGLNAGMTHSGARDAVDAAMAVLDNSIYLEEGRHILPQISLATVPGTADEYLNVKIDDNVAYGVGGYVMASVEVAILRGEIDRRDHP